MSDLPLRQGSEGEAVRDLQVRLAALGFDCDGIRDAPGCFGPATAAAVASFQENVGLDIDGVCGATTWAVLVEAGYRLGDRQLYHRAPMMRGDDIADLQSRLGALGFDPGRADGIFGPATAAAVADFQRNVGLTADGICGPESVAALQRLGAQRTAALPVAHVRERELRRGAAPGVAHRRIAVGHHGGLGALTHAVHRALRDAGAEVLELHHPDGSFQARAANRFEAEAFIAMRTSLGPRNRAAYFKGRNFTSDPGLQLAELVVESVAPILHQPGSTLGMRLPVLRETRMPTILAELGPAGELVRENQRIAEAIVGALTAWTADPLASRTVHQPA
jgi:N-acetylmuramoyl-L-alanine amidase